MIADSKSYLCPGIDADIKFDFILWSTSTADIAQNKRQRFEFHPSRAPNSVCFDCAQISYSTTLTESSTVVDKSRRGPGVKR